MSSIILGIETSCDETAVALVNQDGKTLGARVYSQLEEHRSYGGVVPEIAARAHVEKLDVLIEDVMRECDISGHDLSGIAVTTGPGLVGGLLVGAAVAMTLSEVWQCPLWPINHLEGHALSPRLTADVPFPYLLLLVSGGHCQLILVHDVMHYQRLGSTIDDSLGEAFDKVAKLLELGYPGGPEIERLAAKGDPHRFDLPIPLKGRPDCHFSFSGLKTAVLRKAMRLGRTALEDPHCQDLCASFQRAAFASVLDRTKRALSMEACRNVGHLVVAGGVAANKALRQSLEKLCDDKSIGFVAPPMRLCTDNAEMIAWVAHEHAHAGLSPSDDLDIRSRWPLDADAEPLLGSGKRGAKV